MKTIKAWGVQVVRKQSSASWRLLNNRGKYWDTRIQARIAANKQKQLDRKARVVRVELPAPKEAK